MSFSIFILICTIHLAYLMVYTKFEITYSNRSRKICDRNFHWRERKQWTNKGADMQYVVVFITNKTFHYQALYQISEF